MKDNSSHYPEVLELDVEDMAAASGGWQTVKAGSSWNSIRTYFCPRCGTAPGSVKSGQTVTCKNCGVEYTIS